MLFRGLQSPVRRPRARLTQMAAYFCAGGMPSQNAAAALPIDNLPKSHVFTDKLPPDPAFPGPSDSHKAPRETLGPRLVKGALYTYVRPESQYESELLAVSSAAMRDIGLKDSEEQSERFKAAMAGNVIFWNEATKEGVYPWAQCYGGWQFGSWAGQLGDGRAISLFESTNPSTNIRYEIQLKGAGRTPYSRFADGKAVLRSSIREFIVSEALNALRIPTTRALALTALPHSRVLRERMEPGAIVARFAQSWLRIGTFDLLAARGDRDLIRRLADYAAEEVFGGWEALPGKEIEDQKERLVGPVENGLPKDKIQGAGETEENRYTRLYREIVRRNARTVAAWQAYAFTNGVLNTDNTSILGLSIDFGPFAFLDDFDPNYTPNHDDHLLRYSYRNQPTIIWWNLVRLGESLAELIGAGAKVDDAHFKEKGVTEDFLPELVRRAETVIEKIGEEYKSVFLEEYKRLMTARLGLKTTKQGDFETLYSELLDTMEALEIDFNQFFRKLSGLKFAQLNNEKERKKVAEIFFHREGVTGINNTEEAARERISNWLQIWKNRVLEDWGEGFELEREQVMKEVNPKFIPKSWVLDEVIRRVEKDNDRAVLQQVLHMALHPFQERWEGNDSDQERFCGDVPRLGRAMQCSCSS
ncbi:UPF0061-domain-containing protein [Xylona heveae TC161]|uniref:Selenoprotein O n=1 Tax=Xylona heveae (strain CBS 132557 / TC161) TaxID=1328760 RepID=A0A165AKX0_XYLHT|nr:UPF0061-domain-containing protein [Xylona heveae TC161]KZF20657.1 UPF0061-domain-containing protein [Xylona heveae TC161]